MDLARAPRHTARKKGSGYENAQKADRGIIIRSLDHDCMDGNFVMPSIMSKLGPIIVWKIKPRASLRKTIKYNLGPVYMEAGLARLARQPGKRDEFLLCLYEKISLIPLAGTILLHCIVLTVVKNSLRRYL